MLAFVLVYPQISVHRDQQSSISSFLSRPSCLKLPLELFTVSEEACYPQEVIPELLAVVPGGFRERLTERLSSEETPVVGGAFNS